MELESIKELLSAKAFVIPEYQRPYSWEISHCKDLFEDIETLIKNDFSEHYTGTVVLGKTEDKRPWGGKNHQVWEIIDGQQRITTISLYLAVVLHKLHDITKDKEYKSRLEEYLVLNFDTIIRMQDDMTQTCYSSLLETGQVNIAESHPSQTRLKESYNYFKKQFEETI